VARLNLGDASSGGTFNISNGANTFGEQQGGRGGGTHKVEIAHGLTSPEVGGPVQPKLTHPGFGAGMDRKVNVEIERAELSQDALEDGRIVDRRLPVEGEHREAPGLEPLGKGTCRRHGPMPLQGIHDEVTDDGVAGGGVALQGLQQAAQVQPGETVVVTGAGGGLGTHTVQLAAALGCRVLAVTSSPEKAELLSDLGATEVLLAGELEFSELVLAYTEDQGAQVIIDTVGSVLYPSTWNSLAQFGRWVLLGEVAGNPVSIDPAEVIFRDASILGSSGVSREGVLRIAEMVSQGLIMAVVGQRLPMEEVATAYGLMAERSVAGRILLIPPGSSTL